MLDNRAILDQVKVTLDPKEAKQEAKIMSSFLFAVRHMSNLMKKELKLASTTVSVAVDTRTQTLSGDDWDLEQVFYILYGTGDDQKYLDYVETDRFLKDYNNSAADQDIPSKYTFIGLDDEYPKIKFNCPTLNADNLEVWYYKNITDKDIRESRSPALVNLTLGYFYGLGTDAGLKYLAVAEKLLAASQGGDRIVSDRDYKFSQGRADEEISDLRWSMRDRR